LKIPRSLPGNLAALIGGTISALLLLEVGTRLFWTSAPPAPGVRDSLPLEVVPHPEILYRLVPGSSGHYNGAFAKVNQHGLRGPEFPERKPPGEFRIVVLGDSMVFGVGVDDADTLPARLEAALKDRAGAGPIRVLNEGVFGYNLAQETRHFEDVGARLRPDLLLLSLVHNDMDNWGLSDGGRVPPFTSSAWRPPAGHRWVSALADVLLPQKFDPERLNVLPHPEESQGAGIRYFLTRHSRLYLFALLRLRGAAWSLAGSEALSPVIALGTCQAEEIYWGRWEARLRKIDRMAASLGIPWVALIHGCQLLEGEPLEKLRNLLGSLGVRSFDLEAVWGNRATYARKHALGWDPHPGPAANDLAARRLGDYLVGEGLVPGGPSAESRAPRAESRGVPASSSEPVDLAPLRPTTAGGGRLDGTAARGTALDAPGRALDFRGEGGGRGEGGLLYGWWGEGEGPYGEARGERWISESASLLLAPASPGDRIVIEGRGLDPATFARFAPRSVRVTVGCPGTATDFPLESATFRFEMPVPAEAAEGESLEVSIRPDRTFTPIDLGRGTADNRLFSVAISRVSLVGGTSPASKGTR